MTRDLKNMTIKQLESLGRRVEKRLETLRQKELLATRKELEKRVQRDHGISLEELMAVTSQSSSRRKKSPSPSNVAKFPNTPKTPGQPRFANPADEEQTWTGKGRRPDWFVQAVEAGKSPEELMISKVA